MEPEGVTCGTLFDGRVNARDQEAGTDDTAWPLEQMSKAWLELDVDAGGGTPIDVRTDTFTRRARAEAAARRKGVTCGTLFDGRVNARDQKADTDDTAWPFEQMSKAWRKLDVEVGGHAD